MSATAAPAAYGFRIEGAPGTPWLAVHGADRWPLLTIERDPEQPDGPFLQVDDDRLRATVRADCSDDELLHPGLAWAPLLLAERRGIDALHAGAVLGHDGAWAFVGTKEAGKSTLLAHLAAVGAMVLTDDIVVFEGDDVLAGPRFVDLRPPAARRLAATADVRGGTRSRVVLPPAPAAVPLAGFIHLSWGSELALEPLRAPARLERLHARRNQDGWPKHPPLLLDLAARPAYELRRPCRWESLAASADALAGLLTLPAQAA
ncbi:MAG: hypothetical protein ACJ77M_06590 [Thermoleophilaceae bacterium]